MPDNIDNWRSPEEKHALRMLEKILTDLNLQEDSTNKYSIDNLIKVRTLDKLQDVEEMRKAIQEAVNYIVAVTSRDRGEYESLKSGYLDSFVTNTQFDALLFMRVRTYENLVPRLGLEDSKPNISLDIPGMSVGRMEYLRTKVRYINDQIKEQERPKVYFQFEKLEIPQIPIVAMAWDYMNRRKSGIDMNEVNLKIFECFGEEALVFIMGISGTSPGEIWATLGQMAKDGKDVTKLGQIYERNPRTDERSLRQGIKNDPIIDISNKAIKLSNKGNIFLDVFDRENLYSAISFYLRAGTNINDHSRDHLLSTGRKVQDNSERQTIYEKLMKPVNMEVGGKIGMVFLTIADVFRLFAKEEGTPENLIIAIINEQKLNQMAITFPLGVDFDLEYTDKNIIDKFCREESES